jgi:hypothetical protein
MDGFARVPQQVREVTCAGLYESYGDMLVASLPADESSDCRRAVQTGA